MKNLGIYPYNFSLNIKQCHLIFFRKSLHTLRKISNIYIYIYKSGILTF